MMVKLYSKNVNLVFLNSALLLLLINYLTIHPPAKKKKISHYTDVI